MFNIVLDTNYFLYLFEIVKDKKYTTPIEGINYEYIKELSKNNNCFISSVTLFELLLQCIEREPKNWCSQFEDYFNFIRDYFVNECSIINEKSHMYCNFNKFREFTDENIRGFFNEKIRCESEHLYIFIVALTHPIEQLFLEFFNRKINESNYNNLCEEIIQETKNTLLKICIERYSGKIDNNQFDIQLNEILFCHIYKNLLYLSENYPIDIDKLAWLEQNYPDMAEMLILNIKDYSQSCEYMNYNDFGQILKHIDKSNIKSVDGIMAIFLNLKNSPNFEQFIKPYKGNINDGIKYINQILVNYEKKVSRNIRKKVGNDIKKIFSEKSFLSYSESSKLYIEFVTNSCISKIRRLRKNDVGDYLIASMPDFFDEIDKICIDKDQKTIVLTSDSTMKEFLKSQDLYYDEKIYSEIFI